jgi:hypothetical protein
VPVRAINLFPSPTYPDALQEQFKNDRSFRCYLATFHAATFFSMHLRRAKADAVAIKIKLHIQMVRKQRHRHRRTGRLVFVFARAFGRIENRATGLKLCDEQNVLAALCQKETLKGNSPVRISPLFLASAKK